MSTTSYSVVSCSLVRVPNPYFSSACTSTSWVCGFTCTFPNMLSLVSMTLAGSHFTCRSSGSGLRKKTKRFSSTGSFMRCRSLCLFSCSISSPSYQYLKPSFSKAGIVLVARVYYAVVEVLFPLGRQQAPNPAALSLSLLAVEDDDELVHVLVAQCAGHQAHYPPFEALLP